MIVRCTAKALKIRTLPVVSEPTDSGRRMIANQHAAVYGTSFDGRWVFVEAPAQSGWVYREHTVEANGTLPTPPWPQIPDGLAEIREVFGQPGSREAQAGRIALPVPIKLSWKDEMVRFVACHKLVEGVFQSVFDQIYSRELWDHLEDFGGIYNFRPVRGAQRKLSTHAWGIAVDLNPTSNPLGKAPTISESIIAIFRDHGFAWGGEWRRRDGAHFQYCSGY